LYPRGVVEGLIVTELLERFRVLFELSWVSLAT
jgi:hypothetical protein